MGVFVILMRMFSWMNPKLEVRNAEGRTYRGVFAKERIEAGEKLAIFGGRLIPVAEEIGDWGIQIDENFVINTYDADAGAMEGSFFFNHSCEPNAGIKGQIFLIAMRSIEPGEEVTFDYAMCLHKSEGAEPYRLECHCGHPNCRGTITNNDWKMPELQKKYGGYFSWFLQEKIDKLAMKKKKKDRINARVNG